MMPSSATEPIENLEATQTAVVFPPGDLLSDEPEMESEFHLRQMLLIQYLECWLRLFNPANRCFILETLAELGT